MALQSLFALRMLISLERAAALPQAWDSSGAVQGFISWIGSIRGAAISPAHSTLSELNVALKCPDMCIGDWLWFCVQDVLDAECAWKSFVCTDAVMMHINITW